LQIIGMDVDDDEEQLRAFVKDQGINYPVAMTSVSVRLAYGGIAALPTMFIINQDSKVVQKHVGLFNPALYEVEARALLNTPVPARVETFEDTGEVFLKHADRASMLPGVDTSKLTPEHAWPRCTSSTLKSAIAAASTRWRNAASTIPRAISARNAPQQS
jgi:hypothetical protein